MRICFVYPSYVRHAQANPDIRAYVSTKSYLGSPSASIPILASLTADHHDVTFIDDRIEDIPFDEPFDLVAMPVFTPAANRAIEIADAFRMRNVKVVTGGIFSSLMPQELAPHVDAICIGEGELVWPQILEDAQQGKLRPVYQADAPYDMTKLPIPRYDLFFAKEGPQGYRSTGSTDKITVDYAIQISRGCPLNCLSCVIPKYMGKTMRFALPEWVAKTFETIGGNGDSRHVSLTEDTSSFATTKITNHFIETLSRCVGKGPKVAYTGASPTQALKAKSEYYEHLRNLSTKSIYMVFGFDVMSQQSFSAKSDPKCLQGCFDAVRRVRDEGLGVYASLLVGHDNEDESVFDKILEFALKAELTTAEFVILTPYPGTRLWEKLLNEDRLITRNWEQYNDANPTFRPQNYSAEQLRKGYIYLWKEFYGLRVNAKHSIQV